jgi:integrase
MASIHRKKRSPYWQAYWRDEHGHPHCRSTKQRTRKEAQRVADLWELTAKHKKNAHHIREVFSQIYRDTYGQDLPSVTFRKFAQKWLDEKQLEVAASSVDGYSTTVARFINFLGERADADISLISRDDIIAWRSTLAGCLHPATTNKHLRKLRSVFRTAKRDGYVVDNPLEAVSAVAASQPDSQTGRRPFSLPEIKSLLEIASGEWKSLIRLGFFSGQRLGDLATLRWSNVDLAKNEIRFVARKTNRRLLIPICEPLRDHLLSLSAPDCPDAPLHPHACELVRRQRSTSGLGKEFACLLVEAGLRRPDSLSLTHSSRGSGRSARRRREELSFHSLRRSASTVLSELGVPVSVAQALIGHDSTAVHESYISVGIAALRDAASRLPAL